MFVFSRSQCEIKILAAKNLPILRSWQKFSMGGKIGLDTYCGQGKALCVKDVHVRWDSFVVLCILNIFNFCFRILSTKVKSAFYWITLNIILGKYVLITKGFFLWYNRSQ